MSWNEVDKMSLKKEFVSLASAESIPKRKLCERFDISRKTGYKWIKRYKDQGDQGLQELSRRPSCFPNETPAEIVNEILSIRTKHSCWGGRKIRAILINKGVSFVPAASTISNILKKHGCINPGEITQRNYIRFEHESPNDLWQMDFKGHFAVANGRCYPLTIVDDCSRFSPCLQACTNQKEGTVKNLLVETFEKYGLPSRINVDNGPPWGSHHYISRYTSLGVWLIESGVKISYSRPRHPQTNGKNERFNRTLKAEVLSPNHFNHMRDIQKAFDKWLEIYNYYRPHEALNMDVPGNRYKPSYRSYSSKIEDYEYENDHSLRKVDRRGRIHIYGRKIYVGCSFINKIIGFRNSLEESVKDIYFRHQLLGSIDLSLVKKGIIYNLYLGRN